MYAVDSPTLKGCRRPFDDDLPIYDGHECICSVETLSVDLYFCVIKGFRVELYKASKQIKVIKTSTRIHKQIRKAFP